MQYPPNVNEIAEHWGGAIHFTILERPDSQTVSLGEEITLYIPQSFDNPMTIGWESFENTTGSYLDIVQNDDAGNMDKIKSVMSRFMVEGASSLAGGNMENAVSYAMKTAKNPFMSLAFKTVGRRAFEFQFKFTPHSEDESDVISDIIKTFRKAALPVGCGGALRGYPSEIDIEYIGMAKPWLNKFKRCVLTDIHVNYTGAGQYAAMRNGFPAETELRLQFMENAILCRDDIDDGY